MKIQVLWVSLYHHLIVLNWPTITILFPSSLPLRRYHTTAVAESLTISLFAVFIVILSALLKRTCFVCPNSRLIFLIRDYALCGIVARCLPWKCGSGQRKQLHCLANKITTKSHSHDTDILHFAPLSLQSSIAGIWAQQNSQHLTHCLSGWSWTIESAEWLTDWHDMPVVEERKSGVNNCKLLWQLRVLQLANLSSVFFFFYFFLHCSNRGFDFHQVTTHRTTAYGGGGTSTYVEIIINSTGWWGGYSGRKCKLLRCTTKFLRTTLLVGCSSPASFACSTAPWQSSPVFSKH